MSDPSPPSAAPAASATVLPGDDAAGLRGLPALLGAAVTAGFEAGSIGFVLPALREATGASAQQASWLLSVFVAATLLSVPASALASRRWGADRLLRASLALAVLAGLLGLVLPGPGWVLLARLLLGLAHGPLLPLVAAVVVMQVPVQRQGRLLGLLSMGYGLSFVAATLGTPWLLQLGWRAAFGLGATLAAMSLAWPLAAQAPAKARSRSPAQASSPATEQASPQASPQAPAPLVAAKPPPPWQLVFSRPMQPVVVLALATGIGQATLVWVPTLAVSRLGLAMTDIAPLLVPMLLGGLAATAVVVRGLDRVGARPLALAGGVAAVAGLLLAAGLPAAVALFVAGAAALGFGIGLLSGGPLRYAAARALPREAQGLAQGMVAWITDLGLLGGSLLIGQMAGPMSGSIAAPIAGQFAGPGSDTRAGVAGALGVAGLAMALCLPAAWRLAAGVASADAAPVAPADASADVPHHPSHHPSHDRSHDPSPDAAPPARRVGPGPQ